MNRFLDAPWHLVVVALAVLIGAGFAELVPIGEAPDEAAHLAYLDWIAEHGRIPGHRGDIRPISYEVQQPPLDYVVSALLLRAIHGGPVRARLDVDPSFSFGKTFHRRILPASLDAASRRVLHRLRLLRLFWVAIAAHFTLRLARIFASGDGGLAVAAAAPFALAPQLLFIAGSLANDVSATAIAAGALVGLATLLSEDAAGRTRLALAAGAASALALYAKTSCLALVPATLATAGWLARRGRRADAACLLAAWALPVSGWFALAVNRFGSTWPRTPIAHETLAPWMVRLLAEPKWIARLFVSFWGQFGWLNIPLPPPVYLAFLPASLTALLGLLLSLRSAALGTSPPSAERMRGALLVLVVATNLLLVVGYLIAIDWQPQGRYLFPALPAFAAAAAVGLGSLRGRLAVAPRRLALVSIGFSLLLAGFSLAWVHQAFASS